MSRAVMLAVALMAAAAARVHLSGVTRYMP
jgi:hypothetical protein